METRIEKRGSKPGERRGGRQKGTLNKATLAREMALAKTGILPREVMLVAMRYHFERATKLMRKKPTKTEDKATIEAQATTELGLATAVAAKAAPYVHPTFQSVASTFAGTLTLRDLVEQSLHVPAPANTNAALEAVDEKDAGTA